MLLYDNPDSGNCWKVRLMLSRRGLPCERRRLDVVDRSDRAEVLGGLNPALRVPTLVLDDGHALGESDAILWYLEQHLAEREWLVSERDTIADIALYAYTHVADEGGLRLRELPAVQAWLERVAALPGHIRLQD